MIRYIWYLIVLIFFVSISVLASISLQLPFLKGENFYLTQGYNIGTHIKKDSYALDFAQNGCEAYGKEVAAVADGVVKNVGDLEKTYGLYVDLTHGNVVGRYAHLKNYIVKKGEAVRQGQVIGYIGNTGLNISSGACADYPGTHLHFRVTKILEDGTEIAYKPEPISGYTNLLAGNWYKSDNNLAVASTTTPERQEKKRWFSNVWGKIKTTWNNLFRVANDNREVAVAVTSSAKLVDTNVDQSVGQGVAVTRNSEPVKIESNFENSVSAQNNVSTENSVSREVAIENSAISIERDTNQIVVQNSPPAVAPVFGSVTVIPGFGGGGSGGNIQNIENNTQALEENASTTEEIISTTTPLIISNTPYVSTPEIGEAFATTTIFLSGTSTPNSAVFVENYDEFAIADAFGSWNLSIILPQGTSTLNVLALEMDKATSSPHTIEVFVDSLPPVLSLAVIECQYSIVEDRCFLPISTTTVSVSSSEVASTTLYFNGEEVIQSGDQFFEFVLGLQNGLHEIFAVTEDILGNTASSTVQNIEIQVKPIVLNEIAWRGTSVSPFDEWIELESQTDSVLMMSRFSVETSDFALQIPLSGFLESYGYYLIERTDDETVPTIAASLVTPFSGQGGGSGLSNSGEELLLKFYMGEESVVIDRTPAVFVCGGWCNASSSSSGTMIRLNPSRDGGLQIAWGDDPNTYYPIYESVDLLIAGTPKARNNSNPMPQL